MEMTRAEYVVLQLSLPGRSVSNVGVYLLEAAADRGYLRMRPDWGAVAGEDDREVLEHLEGDLQRLAEEMGGRRFLEYLEDTFSNAIQLTARDAVNVGGYRPALARLYERHVEKIPVRPFVTHLPVYSLRAAAGGFGLDMEVEPSGEVEMPEQMKLEPGMFVARVYGRSMEPEIPDGSLCAFRGDVVGGRKGKKLLVQMEATSETGGQFTVKRYRSDKRPTGSREGDESWEHEKILLEPLNPEFPVLRLAPDEEGRKFVVRGEFLRVVEE